LVHQEVITETILTLAARALGWFFKDGKGKEMGVLVTAWTAVCVVDTWVAKDAWESIAGLCVDGLINVVVELGLLTC